MLTNLAIDYDLGFTVDRKTKHASEIRVQRELFVFDSMQLQLNAFY